MDYNSFLRCASFQIAALYLERSTHKIDLLKMNSFNPPTGPAADRMSRTEKPRRRRTKIKSRSGLLPGWAPDYHPGLSQVTEEPVSPKTIPKQAQPKHPEHIEVQLRQERQLAQPETNPASSENRVKTSRGYAQSHTSNEANTTYMQPVLPPQAQPPPDSHVTGGRVIQVTTYQRVNDTWSDDPMTISHEAYTYSTTQQATDYLYLMMNSIPEETFESHRHSYIIPRDNWESPDVFGLKWLRLYLRENLTPGAKAFMSDEMRDFLESEKIWNEKCEVNLGDYSPPYLTLEMELALFDWRRAMIMGVREDMLRDAGIMPRKGWLRLRGEVGRNSGGGEPGPAISG